MKRTILLGTVAAALGATALGHVYLGRLEDDVSGGPKVAVLVAAQDIPVGAALSEERLAVRDVPRAYVEGRNVRAADSKKVLGGRVAGGLKAGEVLLWSDLEKFQGPTRVLSGLIQQGSRAVAIDSRAADFQGLLRPGDRVDVLLTTGGRDDGGTLTLLQNLLLLSVGGSTVRGDDSSAAKASFRGGSVTVSVTLVPPQVTRWRAGRGRLTLTLHSSGDIEVVEGLAETTAKDLVPAKESVAKAGSGARREVIDHVR